jgi:hypothetical protein
MPFKNLSCVSLLAAVPLVACAADPDAESPTPPVEIVSLSEWNPTLALASDGESLYAARLTRLDRLSAAGEDPETTVAGVDYAQCPTMEHDRWGSTVLDPAHPAFTVSGGRAFMSHPLCGLWAFDLATGAHQTLIHHVVTSEENGARWGEEPGPDWNRSRSIAFAPDGDGLVVCLTVDLLRERIEGKTTELDHVELWSIGPDGAPRERLAATSPRDQRCTHVLADEAAHYFATDLGIYRVDRQSRAVTRLVDDVGASFEYGLSGLAQDATHLAFVRTSAIERVAKDGSGHTVLLRRPAPMQPARVLVATDGEYIYWYEDHDVRRVPVSGGPPSVLVEGTENSSVFPASLVIAGPYLYYQRATRVPSHAITDPETNLTLDSVTRSYAIERVVR